MALLIVAIFINLSFFLNWLYQTVRVVYSYIVDRQLKEIQIMPDLPTKESNKIEIDQDSNDSDENVQKLHKMIKIIESRKNDIKSEKLSVQHSVSSRRSVRNFDQHRLMCELNEVLSSNNKQTLEGHEDK